MCFIWERNKKIFLKINYTYMWRRYVHKEAVKERSKYSVLIFCHFNFQRTIYTVNIHIHTHSSVDIETTKTKRIMICIHIYTWNHQGMFYSSVNKNFILISWSQWFSIYRSQQVNNSSREWENEIKNLSGGCAFVRKRNF